MNYSEKAKPETAPYDPEAYEIASRDAAFDRVWERLRAEKAAKLRAETSRSTPEATVLSGERIVVERWDPDRSPAFAIRRRRGRPANRDRIAIVDRSTNRVTYVERAKVGTTFSEKEKNARLVDPNEILVYA